MILSKKEILAAIASGEIEIEPYSPERVGAASVDLTVSRWFRRHVASDQPLEIHDDTDYRDPTVTELVEVPKAGYLEIASREMVLGITHERVRLSDSLCGWFDGRSRFARLGLLVHISAGFMQPGTFNNTVLELFNMSPRPLRLYPGSAICQFIFQRMEGAERHSGRFSGQTIDVFRGI